MRVNDLMLKDITSVESGDTIRTLVDTLETSESTSIPVTNEDGRLVGIISERDVLAAALPKYMEMLHTASFLPNLDQLTQGLQRIGNDSVERHMCAKPVSIRADAHDLQAADIMLRKGLRLLPVIDGEGRLVGVVRRVDLFRHVL